MTSLHLLIQAI